TAIWLRDLPPRLYGKLVIAGLVCEREQTQQETLAAFIDGYISKRTDVKPHTRTNLKQVRDNLVDFFGADKPLADVTDGCADEFRPWLGDSEANEGRGLAINTVRRRCGRARQFFRAAVKHRLLANNPFGDMKDIWLYRVLSG
ncbi:MAG: phage integrase SAM-like domain-containing protein, partial [Acidobacteriaceae bacterium]